MLGQHKFFFSRILYENPAKCLADLVFTDYKSSQKRIENLIDKFSPGDDIAGEMAKTLATEPGAGGFQYWLL